MEQTKLNEIRIKYTSKPDKSPITSSRLAYDFTKAAYVLTESNVSLKEYFFIILLNRANKSIGFHKLAEGGISGTVADIRLAFSIALKCVASSMILCHNHPSGNLDPSEADLKLTRKFRDAGELLDIKVLDHLIITDEGYKSFADEGLL